MYDSSEFWPQPLSSVSTVGGLRDDGARESSANNVNWFKVVSPTFSDVAISLYLRPMFSKDTLAKVVNLNLPETVHARALESKIESTNTSK